MADTTTKTSNSTIDKGTFMDDAPLFAGLDDFVMTRSENKKTGRPKQAAPAKKKATALQERPATMAEPLSPKQPKARRPRPSDPNALLLTVTEVCALLRISRATLIRMDKAGTIPGRIKLGGSVRFHREIIEAWLKSLIDTPPSAVKIG